ncbi:MAG: hypothetical protein AVDCRST_MAG91-347, partial [uncultured Sphingomonadaceae bacterium]
WHERCRWIFGTGLWRRSQAA